MPDGGTLVTGSEDGSVKIWNSRSGRLLATLLVLPPRSSGLSCAEWVAFTPNGFFEGSRGAGRFLSWTAGDRKHPFEKFKNQFRRPDLLRKSISSTLKLRNP